MISIITINLNNLSGLVKTVQSVINQSFRNFEFIIVDGDSSDGSSDYIEQNKAHFNHYLIEKDNGVYEAMNKGIQLAEGDYLLFLNSGDYLIDNYALTRVSLTHDVEIYESYSGLGFVFGFSSPVCLEQLLLRAVPHQSTFYKRSIFGLYDITYKIGADRKQNLRLYLNKYSFNSHQICISYYDKGGISSNPKYLNAKSNESQRMELEIFGTELGIIIDQWKKDRRRMKALNNSIFFRSIVILYRKLRFAGINRILNDACHNKKK
jgi:glycosyltransferase involved in cell wall biosynthesis